MKEAWTIQRKKKQAQMMKRKSKVIAKAKARKAMRHADPKTLMTRAEKTVRAKIFKKLAGGKSKSEFSMVQSIAIEKKMAKFKSKIKKMAKKILPAIKKAEAERMKNMNKGKDIDPSKKVG